MYIMRTDECRFHVLERPRMFALVKMRQDEKLVIEIISLEIGVVSWPGSFKNSSRQSAFIWLEFDN